MSKSIKDVIDERMQKFGTLNNNFSDFPIGTRVQIITFCEDFRFFKGIETGIVVENKERYLSIIVELDDEYKNPNYSNNQWGFNPESLFKIGHSFINKNRLHPSELLLSYPEFMKCIESKELDEETKEWYNHWKFYDTAVGTRNDNDRRYIRYGHYQGWFAFKNKT